jgi:hypothetical protein
MLMRNLFTCLLALFLILAFASQSFAQQTQAAPAASGTSTSPVPRLIKFSGILLDHQGQPLKGPVGVIFSLYAQQSGDAPLWMETQNVEPDAKGAYTVLLGANTVTDLPEELFFTGEARWLGIQPERESELPRVLLVSAPYALKAADADTLGGLPASAFVLAGVPTIATNGSSSSPTSETTASVTIGSSSSAVAPAVGTIPVTTAGGIVNLLAKFDAAADITKSLIFDNGTNVGIGNTAPAAKLDVSGSGIFRGFLQLPATGTATSTLGFNSQPFDLLASAWNTSGSPAAVSEHFRWQAEPVGNNTISPSGKLNLLFASGTGTPAETGLSISSNGRITFASGQTFPGTGTITGVIAGTDLTGGGTVGNVTLNLDTTKIPRLAAANIFVGNQSVTGNLTASSQIQGGVVNATTSYDIGGTPFAFGSVKTFSAFLGFSGNAASTGNFNTAGGYQALLSNTTGFNNTANGAFALASNTTGGYNTASGINALHSNITGGSNTASGASALRSNTTGFNNTADGGSALHSNTTGSYNTALGYDAGSDSTQPSLSNATAIGAYADVAESNALVLGSINGVNGATSSTNVGIGTTTPLYTLDVHGTGNFTGPVNFSVGQTFPGTITSVSPGTGLTSSVIGSNVTLNVDTTKVPQLSAANTFTASQNVIGSVTATNVAASGTVTGGMVNATSVNAVGAVNSGVVNATTSFEIGGTAFAFGSYTNRNSFLGFAGNATATGSFNTASGFLALYANTTGDANTASGANALLANTTGFNNTANGVGALFSNTSGDNNTASGASSLGSNTSGGYNTASGNSALIANNTGYWNTASGSNALRSNTTANYNTASGASALYSNNTGCCNTATGFQALYSNTTGSYNTANGLSALQDNTTGSDNTASGANALLSNTTGTLLTCIGYYCATSVDGLTNATAIGANAVVGESNALVLGNAVNVGIGTATPQYTLDVVGNVHISGSLSKGSGSFKIDHPLDPANKYLYHSFVESPDMMNVYNGNVVTDKQGMATVVLPEYFEALNRDFRYQLTVVGQFAQAIVAKKVDHNRFVIRTSKPNVEVSWQVTGIRQDAYANAHRIEVEEDKPQQEQGHYLHPELFGAPPEQAVGYQAPPTPTHAETARVSTSTSPSCPLK